MNLQSKLNQQSPLRLFLLILALESLLLVFAYFNQQLKDEIDEFKEANQLDFHYFTLNNLFNFSPNLEVKKTEELIDQIIQTDDNLEEELSEKGKLDAEISMDSSINILYKSADQIEFVATDTFSRNMILNPIDENGISAMDHFFASLFKLETYPDTLVRIAYYGDSQIEGDRISGFLRRSMQLKFGGNGLGYLPIVEPASHHSYLRKSSELWERYNIFNKRLKHSFYGLSGCNYQIVPDSSIEISDSINPSNEKLIADVHYTFKPNVNYQRLGLMWGNASESFQVTLSSNDSIYYEHLFPEYRGFHVTYLPLPPNKKDIKLTFEADISPQIFGLTLDSYYGIQIDNYAIRGHSGGDLLRIGSNCLKQQLNKLNTKLFIFQFGGNIVPYDNVKTFKWYENALVKVINKFKSIEPDASILVIGVGDAAHKVDGEFVSYETVPKILAAQKNAATRTGCAFWDLHQAMGGKNSMISWVNHDPPLAAHDYAHFSYYGQKLISKLLFSAIMKEYNRYVYKQKNIFGSETNNEDQEAMND